MGRKRCKQFLALVALCVMLVVTSGCVVEMAASSAMPIAVDSEPIQLRVTAFPYLSFAPLYIADANGFFADQGIEVEFVRFQGNAESLPALLHGDVDVDSIFTVGLLNAIARGEKVRIVANKGELQQNDCSADAFFVRQELASEMESMSPAAQQALTYGVDPTWLDSYLLQLALAERGVDADAVATEYVPNPAARVEALSQGALDVAFLSEPWITRAQEAGAGSIWLPAAEIAPGYSLGVLTFGPSLLERDDDAGVRFMQAYLQGIAAYNEGKTARNIEILAEVTQLEPDLLARVCWPVFAADGLVDAGAIASYSTWATAQELADSTLKPEEFWEPRFVMTAKELLSDDLAAKP